MLEQIQKRIYKNMYGIDILLYKTALYAIKPDFTYSLIEATTTLFELCCFFHAIFVKSSANSYS